MNRTKEVENLAVLKGLYVTPVTSDPLSTSTKAQRRELVHHPG